MVHQVSIYLECVWSSILGVEPSKRRPIQNKGPFSSKTRVIWVPCTFIFRVLVRDISLGHRPAYFMAALLFHAQESWTIARMHQLIEKHILVKKCLLKTSSWYFEAISSFSMLQRTGSQKKILDGRKFLTTFVAWKSPQLATICLVWLGGNEFQNYLDGKGFYRHPKGSFIFRNGS